jgi:hypothetical protein
MTALLYDLRTSIHSCNINLPNTPSSHYPNTSLTHNPIIPPFHYSIIPGWDKQKGWWGIPYYQQFVEIPLLLILNDDLLYP